MKLARSFVFVITLCVGSFAMASEPAGDAGPFAAHNAYPYRLYPKGRFESALDAGLKHVELDITYDPRRKTVVVTHDAQPNGKEPELGTLLATLFERWAAAPGDGYTIILDFKTSSPEIVAGVAELLDPHRDVLTLLAKQSDGRPRTGKITVCFTGNTAAHRLYEESVAAGDDYLGFGDGGAGGWLENPADHVPEEPARFVRFLTYEQSVFADAPGAKGPEHLSLARLKAVVDAANARGYRVRVYTLNPPRRDGGRDFQAWEKCVAAGMHMIATDAYAESRQWWNEQQNRRSAGE